MTKEEAYNQRLLEIKKELGNIGVPISTILIKKEINQLPHILDPDEKIIHAVTGNWEGSKNGLLVATDKKLIFQSYGLFHSFQENISYDKMNPISCRFGIHYADITIVSEKSIVIENVNNNKNALSFCDTVNNYLLHLKKEPISIVENQSSNPETDIMEQLKKLGKLRENGILTDQEFTEQKKKLLDRL
jgi:hypothetical protein